MQPHNFNVPNKKNPFVLPDYNTRQLDEPNTGIFHEKTSEIYQCSKKNIRVFLPFLSLVDRTLVARNSVEPITLCPGIFKRSVLNLAKYWIIAGFIKDTHTFLGEFYLPPVTLTQTGKKKQKISKFRNPKKPKVNMVHMNLTGYHNIIIYIMDHFVALHKSVILFRIILVNGLFEYITFVPVLQFIISYCKEANTLTSRFGGHTKVIKGLPGIAIFHNIG